MTKNISSIGGEKCQQRSVSGMTKHISRNISQRMKSLKLAIKQKA